MPDRSACSQHSVWLVTLATATFTSVLLGFAVALSTSPSAPALHATCATKSDPAFWQRLAQLFVHLAVLACLVSPAVRPHTRDRVRLSPGRGWFFAAVGLSALAQVLSLASYAAACWNSGWTAALFMGWIADVTLLGAAAQLAGGIARSRRRSSSSGTFAMGHIRTPASADAGTQS
ncbi:hypothetical protein PG997_013253 [Apiospora hydei]|uniref:Uncharacterized protein n=1 Tax=Apiospora hydei TaxID=1337664 RepID=A0ABR1V5N5_9PEZI